MARRTIPSVEVTICDKCRASSEDNGRAFAGGRIQLVVNPRSGLRGDTREADLCTSCMGEVIARLASCGLQLLSTPTEELADVAMPAIPRPGPGQYT